MSILEDSSKRQKLHEVSDDAVEENVGTLRRTVSGLEAELKRARDELECYLEIPASMRGEPTGTETKGCWDSLPSELLQKIASGRDKLKAMQLVSKHWKLAFWDSVTKVHIGVSGYTLHPLPCISNFANLVSVQLLGDLCGASLQILQGSRVRVLNLSGCKGVTAGIFVTLKGTPLTELNLSRSEVNDDGILALCKLGLPLEKLNLSHTDVGDCGIEALLELPLLRTLSFDNFNTEMISSAALGSIGKLPLASLKLSAGNVRHARNDEDFDLDCVSLLRGMQLSKLDLGCRNVKFTEAGLAGLVGMPLESLFLTGYSADFSSAGLECLRGLPLEWLYLSMSGECSIKPSEWGVIQGMPLKSLTVRGDMFFNDSTLEYVRGLPLERLHLQGAAIDGQSEWVDLHITDEGFSHLKGLPLASLDVHARISDWGLASLEGLPLTRLSVKGLWWGRPISDRGFEWGLRGKNLEELSLSNTSHVTDMGVQVLQGMPLRCLTLTDCRLITDASLGIFRCLPLFSLKLDGCLRITDFGLSALGGSLIESLSLTGCSFLTWAGLRNLEGLPKLQSLTIAFGERLNESEDEQDWATNWDMGSLREALSGKMKGEYDYYND